MAAAAVKTAASMETATAMKASHRAAVKPPGRKIVMIMSGIVPAKDIGVAAPAGAVIRPYISASNAPSKDAENSHPRQPSYPGEPPHHPLCEFLHCALQIVLLKPCHHKTFHSSRSP